MVHFQSFNLFRGKKTSFHSHLNKVTMTFKNEEYENSYQKYKFGKKNLLVIIGISIIFNFVLLGIGSIDAFFQRLFNYGLGIHFEFNQSFILIIVPFLICGIEALTYFIEKIVLFRGFASSLLLTVGANLMAKQYSTTIFNVSEPIYVPTCIFMLFTQILIALLYSANWICGSIQIIILFSGIDYFIFSYPGNWLTSKPFWIGLSINLLISFILSIYYLEYFQRKSTFRRIKSENQAKALMEIIEKIPEPIIISQKGKIKWANNSFIVIGSSNQEIGHPNDEICVSERGFNKNRNFSIRNSCLEIARSIISYKNNFSLP